MMFPRGMALIEMKIVVDQPQCRLGKREVSGAQNTDHTVARFLEDPHLRAHRDVVHPGAGARIGEKNCALATEHPEAIRHDSPGLLLATTRPSTRRICL
jgi:hypothetical protein